VNPSKTRQELAKAERESIEKCGGSPAYIIGYMTSVSEGFEFEVEALKRQVEELTHELDRVRRELGELS
jgi:hypothetical protein